MESHMVASRGKTHTTSAGKPFIVFISYKNAKNPTKRGIEMS
jgi:hypothetical protein